MSQSRTHDPFFFTLQEALAGKYSLEDELGRGGMGIVYLALDVILDRPVALKVLPQDLAKVTDLRKRFLREARTAAKLSHPNIVPIHSVHEIGEFVFFAMAYVAGETLGQRIRRRGPLAPSDCMRMMREVAFALNYAHAQGVIHRDIKPDNILLEEATGRALVADFGIAGVMDPAQELGRDEIVGTLEFMSPEQAAGVPVDHRSDLYSLGMVGFYALTGELPFRSDDDAETLRMVRYLPAPPVASVAHVVPRRLARVVDGCLKKETAERFDSADTLAAALDAAAAARRQVPVAVRTFLYDPIDLGGDALAYATIAAMGLPPLIQATVETPAGGIVLVGYSLVAIGVPTATVPARVRRLLASGNTHADVILGLRQDLEQRKEESPHHPLTAIARIRSGIRRASLLTIGGSWILYWVAYLADTLGFPMPVGDEARFFTLVLIGGASAIGLLLTQSAGEDERALRKAERRLSFWQSRLGRLIFKVCGIGLGKKAADVRATHRPTEVQIGLAVESLFATLPKPTRKALGDVPGTVAELEAHATRLRQSIEVLTEVQSASIPAGVEFPRDLRQTREEAEAQLAKVVAALESIRLGLLRLTNGIGTVESLTTDLLAASDIRQDALRLLEGVDEVESALRGS